MRRVEDSKPFIFIFLLACRISTRRGRNGSKRSKFCTDVPAALPTCASPHTHRVGQSCPAPKATSKTSRSGADMGKPHYHPLPSPCLSFVGSTNSLPAFAGPLRAHAVTLADERQGQGVELGASTCAPETGTPRGATGSAGWAAEGSIRGPVGSPNSS